MNLSHVNGIGSLPPAVLKAQVDGILMEGSTPSAEIINIISDIPTVWFMTQNLNPALNVDEVYPDEERIGQLAADYLISKHLKHVAFLNSESNLQPFHIRGKAFEAHCLSSNIQFNRIESQAKPSSGIRRLLVDPLLLESLVDRFMSLSPRPTGIFIPSDMQAAILQQILNRRGIRVGKDVTIVSCNNEAVILAGLDPKPVSIDMSAEAIGNRAVEQLMWRIQNPDEPRIKVLIGPTISLAEETY